MQLWFHVFFLTQLYLAFAALGCKRRKCSSPPTQRPINWNLSYYSEPFKLCKTKRVFNPVEQARVHGIATQLFRTCGPKLIVPYATQYKLPAFALLKTGDIICFMCIYGAAFLEINGIAKDPDDKVGKEMRDMVNRFCSAMERGDLRAKVKHRGEVFVIRSQICYGLITDILECAIRKVGVRDADYAIYAVQHFMKLLL